MISEKELNELEAKPLRVWHAYVACDCTCPGGHDDGSVTFKTCRVCGDLAETHYRLIPVTDDLRILRLACRRGYEGKPSESGEWEEIDDRSRP